MNRHISDLIDKLKNQYGFRTVVFAYVTFIISVAFAAFNAVVSALTSSFWYGALAAYYFLLATTRFGIILHHRKSHKLIDEPDEKKKTREIKTYRICGIILIFLSFALLAAVLQMVLSNHTFVNPGLTIYFVAVYAFYKIIMAIINLVKARKDNDITIQAIRNVNFSEASVSILALQTAMLHEFGAEMTEITIIAMNAATGGVVCIVTAAIGILMIVKAALITKNGGQLYEKANGR